MADGFDFHNDMFVLAVIRRRVLLLARAPVFNESEVDDLIQEIHLRLMRSIQSYDPAIGHPYPFLCTAIQRIASKIFRERSTVKRQTSGRCSLSEVVRGADGESCELYQLLRQEDQDRRLCRKTARSDEERASIRIDLSSAIQKLPPVCQEIVRRLRTQNVSEISREMGIPRTTINDWLRQIRQQFDDAGLRAYLEE